MGRVKRPFYRIVAIDSRTRRDGPEIERLGWFDPLKTDVAVELNEDRIIHWLEQGAQLSDKVRTIFTSTGLQYKLHLMREGKSEEEIAAALIEWQLGQEEKRARKAEKKLAKKKAAAAPAAEELADGETSATNDAVEEPVKGDVQEAAAVDDSPSEEETPAVAEETEEVQTSEEPVIETKASDDAEETVEEKPVENDTEEVQASDETVSEDEAKGATEMDDKAFE